MTNSILLKGIVATTPRHVTTLEGLAITSFRLASDTQNPESTNWFTVSTFNALAVNAAGSVSKGDRVIVAGLLRVRMNDNAETNCEIVADTLGHDLAFGTTEYTAVKGK